MTDNNTADFHEQTIVIGDGATAWWVVVHPPLEVRSQWFFPFAADSRTFADGMAAGTGWRIVDRATAMRHPQTDEPNLLDLMTPRRDTDGGSGA